MHTTMTVYAGMVAGTIVATRPTQAFARGEEGVPKTSASD